MKLRKIFSIAGLSVLMTLGACQDVLEVEPPFNKEGSQIFKTIEDFDFVLTGAYAQFRSVGYFGSGGQTTSTWANLPDMMGTDLVRTAEDLGNWQTQVNWTYTADENDLEVAWSAAYYVVVQANLVLRSVDQFAATNAKAVNRIKGQALAIRAMVHFDLLRYWGESYDRNSTALGVPYVESVDQNLKPGRLTVAQTYDKIFADLQQAETLLGDVDRALNTASSRAYLDQTAVRALLARVNLYAKQYAAAETFATQVIDARPLATRAQFPAIWTDASQAEVIWSVAFNLGEGVPAAGVHISSTNRNRFRPSPALEATYDQANDIRFTSYFASRTLGTNTRRIITKWYGRNFAPPVASDNLVNWKAIRTGEVYLIRAEARAFQAGKEAAAMADLNALRAARISNYVAEDLSTDVPALRAAIALERRKELVGEGHQWFDIKRSTKTIARPAGDGHLGATPLNLAADKREWNWPIPTNELLANPTIATQQTTGY